MENVKQNESAFRPFGMRDKIAYAAGDFGCNMSFALKGTLFLFYTQFIGLPVVIWSAIILVMQIWDAINDPIIGGLLDSVKPGKRGKFMTWIFWGSLLLMVSGAMLFIPIPSAPLWLKIVVACVGYAVWDLSYTMVNVPYGSLNAVITADSTERAQLSTWRSIGALLANLIIMVVLPIIIYDKKSNLLGTRVFFVALVLGVLGFLAFQFMIKNTVERIKPTISETPQKFNYFVALKNFVKNRAAMGITLASFVQIIVFQGMTAAQAVLTQTYFNASQMSGLSMIIMMLPTVFIIPFIKPIVKKFGKKESATFPMLLGVISSIFMIIIPFPRNLTGFILWSLFGMLNTLSYAVFMMVGWAMVADAIDYNEWKTGRREEGTTYAIYSFGRKLAQGIGASAIGLLLLAVGYVEETKAVQTIAVANNIKILVASLYLIGVVLQFVFLKFYYNLDKKTVEQMETELGRNNTEKVGELPTEE